MVTTISIESFKVDLQQLQDAIGTVSAQAQTIGEQAQVIQAQLAEVPSWWSAPSEVPFSQLAMACTNQLNGLVSLLQEMITRMNSAYQNYLSAETANVSTLH